MLSLRLSPATSAFRCAKAIRREVQQSDLFLMSKAPLTLSSSSKADSSTFLFSSSSPPSSTSAAAVRTRAAAASAPVPGEESHSPPPRHLDRTPTLYRPSHSSHSSPQPQSTAPRAPCPAAAVRRLQPRLQPARAPRLREAIDSRLHCIHLTISLTSTLNKKRCHSFVVSHRLLLPCTTTPRSECRTRPLMT